MRRAEYGFWVLGCFLAAACGDDGVADGGESGSTSAATPTTLGTLSTSAVDEGSGSDGAGTTGGPATMGEPTTTDGSESDGSGSTGEPPPQQTDCEALELLVASLRDDPVDGEAEIHTFFGDVAYGEHGFPMLDDDRMCFAYRDAVGVPISVAGDFNAWEPDEHALEYAAEGFDLRYAIIDRPADAGGLYKFVRANKTPEFFADPSARRFGWDEFGEYSRIAPDATASHIERWPAFDEAVGSLEPRDVTVYVPAGGFSEEDLAVLYMHDGQNLFSPEAFFGGWRAGAAMDAGIGDGSLPPTLIVAINNTAARFDEYTHVEDGIDGRVFGGRAQEYADFVVDGVKPFIDARYPTSRAVERTGVAGSSLGGLVSLYLGWRHPDVFGAASSMSGTLGWGSFELGNPVIADLFADDPPEGLRLYVDSGGDGDPGCPGGGSDNYCDNVAFADTLRSLGWVDDADLRYVWQPGAPHNELAWADRLPAMLSWFPGNL